MAVCSFVSESCRYADGGPMPMQGAPAPAGPPMGAPDPAAGGAPQGGGQDPGDQLQAAAMQYAQTKDPQLAVQIADTVVQVMGLDGGREASAPMGNGAPAGKPMSADQQMKAKKDGQQAAGFGKK